MRHSKTVAEAMRRLSVYKESLGHFCTILNGSSKEMQEIGMRTILLMVMNVSRNSLPLLMNSILKVPQYALIFWHNIIDNEAE